jgi:restriction system protein
MAKAQRGKSEFVKWMGPLLDCLRASGGTARPREASGWIKRELKLPDTVTDITLKSGANRFHNQVQWARQYLVWQGLIDDAQRGVWTLTPLGWKTHLDNIAARELFVARVAAQGGSSHPARSSGDKTSLDTTPADDSLPADEAIEASLLDVLRGLPPRGFELLCVRILREHGFEDVEVTRQSRDGGIDGYGTLRLSPFVSLKVAFQAKRYKDIVGRAAVGEFRNALLGRAEKGVFITTGRFSSDAQSEASRDGVVPIELIDGERLVELFEARQLGVKPKQIFEIDQAFFDHFR